MMRSTLVPGRILHGERVQVGEARDRMDRVSSTCADQRRQDALDLF
jgi:hypothetical protein